MNDILSLLCLIAAIPLVDIAHRSHFSPVLTLRLWCIAVSDPEEVLHRRQDPVLSMLLQS
jgi:hypothetical protein